MKDVRFIKGSVHLVDPRIEALGTKYKDLKHTMLEFDCIFSYDKEIEPLGELLPDFFKDLAKLYWEYVILNIAKLLDPYQQGGGQFNNLSLYVLPEVLLDNDNKLEATKVKEEIDNLKSKFGSELKLRSKYLAHFDLGFAIGNEKFDTSTHFDEVMEFLDKMLELINKSLKLIGNVLFKGVVSYHDDYKGAKELMEILKKEKLRRDEQK